MQPARAVLPHIDDSTPRPVLAGNDLKVAQIASEHEHLGMTPGQIVEAHPYLSLADVHAPLSSSFEHMEAIRADSLEGERLIVKMKKTRPDRSPGAIS